MATDEIDTGWEDAPAAAPQAPRAAPTMPSPAPPRAFHRSPMPPLAAPPRSSVPPASAASSATYAAITARAPLPVRPSGVSPATPRPPADTVREISPSPSPERSGRQASRVSMATSNYDIEPPVSSGVLPVMSHDLATALEEADFFIAQGLIRDARTLLLEQLLSAPRHPAIVSRLASISSGPASSRGSATG